MSTAVYVTFKDTVTMDVFRPFANENKFLFSPNTVGQNTFYCDQVEISVCGNGTLPEGDDGRPDFDSATPPESFSSMTVSSYQGCNYDAIVSVATSIIQQFPCSFDCDPEIQQQLEDAVGESATETSEE